MLVIVQIFACYIVLRNLASDYFWHTRISRMFDPLYGIRFERIAFFCQLVHTFGVCNRAVRNLLSRSTLSGRFEAKRNPIPRHP